MSDPVSGITSPNDRRFRFNVQFDLGDTWYGSHLSGAIDSIEDTITIRN